MIVKPTKYATIAVCIQVARALSLPSALLGRATNHDAQNQYSGGVAAKKRVDTCTCSTVKHTPTSAAQCTIYGKTLAE